MRKLTFFILLAAFPNLALAETPKGTIPVVTLDETTTSAPKTEVKVTPTKKPVVKKVKPVTKPAASTTAIEPAAIPVTPSPVTTPPVVKTAKTPKVKTAKVKTVKVKEEKVKTAKVKKVKAEKPIKAALKEKTLSPSAGHTHALKGSFTLGVAGTAFLDFGSEEDMYLSAADKAAIVAAGGTVQSVTAGGIGANVNAEYGFSDRWSGTLSAGYDRLTYANHFKNVVTESFFAVDVTANYYLLKDPKAVLPYLSAGAGLVAGSTKTLPTLDIGGGAHFFVSDKVSIKAQLLAKMAFVFNRLQPSVGVNYHFK